MKDEVLRDIIRKSGFRATTQRVELLSFLSTAKKPLRIQEIADGLGKTMDTVTVYRMIEAFAKKGILREVNLRGGNPRYELNEDDHHHLVCTDCGRVEDFTDIKHEEIGKRVLERSKSFKKITGHSFDLYGVCNTCVK